jgi:hypothetical protein
VTTSEHMDDAPAITIDQVRAEALAVTGLTPAQFDYSLAVGSGPARAALLNACYTLSNEGLPSVRAADKIHAADALRRALRVELAQQITDAQARKYIGWSRESQGPIRYADESA